ncbi:type I-F CRISPR-associated protein Csy1 [Pseudomonas aeruginosa]
MPNWWRKSATKPCNTPPVCANWSPAGAQPPGCQLHDAEQLWLDPLRAQTDETFLQRRLRGDWPAEVGNRFANWLNRAVSSDSQILGSPEAAQWSQELSKELTMFKEILEDERD